MRVTRTLPLALLSFILATGAGCVDLGISAADYHPQLNPADFQANVDNPYYPLVPGTTYKFVEKFGAETSENVITVTHDTKTVAMGMKCVVVHDTVTKNGVLAEDTYDWFTQDKQGTVWYCGEATKELKSTGVSTEGSWEAGVKGALPGIIMPGQPKPGDPYYQEYYRGEAEDMGQIVALDDTVTVPFGTFKGCVKTKEWSMLESGNEIKWYAKGVGVVRTESTAGEIATLVSMTRE